MAETKRQPPPTFYEAGWVDQVEAPWIFRLRTPAGKELRTAIWDGRRNYAHELPAEVVSWVGGDRIAIVQVETPVGINRRSSLESVSPPSLPEDWKPELTILAAGDHALADADEA